MLTLKSGNYRSIQYTAEADITKGALIEAATIGGSLCGFAGFADVLNTALMEVVTYAENCEATKVAGDSLAFAAGEKVYYNVSGAKVSKTGTDVFIGYAKRVTVAADTVQLVEFDGSLNGMTFADLADVNVAGVTNNDTLKFETSSGTWIDVAVTD